MTISSSPRATTSPRVTRRRFSGTISARSSPSGMTFYTGNLFASWRGSLFIGALAGQVLVRLELDGDKPLKEERLLQELRERIRDVREGPDGALWLATDSSSGRILRLAPVK